MKLQSFLQEKGAVLTSQPKEFYRLKELCALRRTGRAHQCGGSWFNLKFADKWRPFCSKYQTERKMRAAYEEKYGKPIPSVRPDWLEDLDGYSEELALA